MRWRGKVLGGGRLCERGCGCTIVAGLEREEHDRQILDCSTFADEARVMWPLDWQHQENIDYAIAYVHSYAMAKTCLRRSSVFAINST